MNFSDTIKMHRLEVMRRRRATMAEKLAVERHQATCGCEVCTARREGRPISPLDMLASVLGATRVEIVGGDDDLPPMPAGSIKAKH